MEGKFNKTEKILEVCALLVIVIALIVKSMTGETNTGNLVMMGFVSILLYIILLVCSLFPATWRMTQQQKDKIKDLNAYQAAYRKVFVIINFVLCFLMALIILLLL